MENLNFIKQKIQASINVKELWLNDNIVIETIEKIVNAMVHCYDGDGKVLFCGNGGSAADAQHISAELSGRFYTDREPLFAEALHVNTSYMTAVANDYSYDEVFARMVKAMGRKGDILVGLSTSGNSKNVIKAFEVAKQRGMIVVAMTGETGGNMKSYADFLLNVPSKDTPRIQESHILMGHIICEMVENKMFKK
jgi:D-sedoheptulose 7-phosphate isomerase